MSSVTLPAGEIAVRPRGADDDLLGARVVTFRFDLLDRRHRHIGTLEGVTGGHVEWTAHTSIKGGGLLTLTDIGQEVDWDRVRIKPYYSIDGGREWPLSVWIPSVSGFDADAVTKSFRVELHDRALALDQYAIDATYEVAAGTNGVDAIRDVIEMAGEDPGALTPTDKVIPSDRAFPAGTTALEIVSALATMLDFFSLRVDLDGEFVVAPYARPADRPKAARFLAGPTSVLAPQMRGETDAARIPNKVVLTSFGGPDEEPLVGVATNEDPNSPYSYQSRDDTWIVHSDRVDVADQDTIDTMAKSVLAAKTPSETLDIEIAPWPLQINDVVELAAPRVSVAGIYAVTKSRISFNESALQSLRIRKAVA